MVSFVHAVMVCNVETLIRCCDGVACARRDGVQCLIYDAVMVSYVHAVMVCDVETLIRCRDGVACVMMCNVQFTMP